MKTDDLEHNLRLSRWLSVVNFLFFQFLLLRLAIDLTQKGRQRWYLLWPCMPFTGFITALYPEAPALTPIFNVDEKDS